MRPADLLLPTPAGLYCPVAGVHIDPVRPVARALVTHGHADHARAGHGAVLATAETLGIMAVRYGENFAETTQVAELGRPIDIGGVTATFHPAGHVLGSAQIAFECKGLRIVVSGDYKRARDPTCEPFEVVPCDVFITEATFGLPVFRHPELRGEVDKLLASVRLFPERAHLVGAYSLGKAQRMMRLIRDAGHDAPIYIHGALEKLTEFYQANGIALGDVRKVVTKERSSWPAPSCCARRARSRISGPAAFPIPSRRSPPAGCGCAPAPGSAAWSCRSSSPTIPTGTISAAPSSTPALARSGSRTGRRTRWSTGA